MKIIGLIPARGGSKGIKNKNIKDLNGLPLIAHTINAALKSTKIDEVYVTSDSDEILDIAKKYQAQTIERPNELSLDSSSSDSVVEHAINHLSLDSETIICFLQPTSPFRNHKHIDEAIDSHLTKNPIMTVGCKEGEECIFKAMKIEESGLLTGYFSEDAPFRPRQEFEEVVFPNGSIYIYSVKEFLKEKNFPRKGLSPYQMSQLDSLDIDSEVDLLIAQAILGSSLLSQS